MEGEKANNQIALVDDQDNIIGYGDKLKVHLEGTLHRGIFNHGNQWKGTMASSPQGPG
jgi:isopentenyldiphosphate isomerase